MKVSITSRKTGIFDGCPICDVFIDKKCVGKILPGKTVSYDLSDNQPHSIYCSYSYDKYNTEKSNIVYINDSKNHDFVLGVIYSKTYIGRFKENIKTFFSKGYINVPDIEIYEKD